LANALNKLEMANKRRPMRKANPATSSLFIVNPFSGSAFVTIFSTHPPMKERIRRLEAMSSDMGHY
jgi:heat shock protein HtpX